MGRKSKLPDHSFSNRIDYYDLEFCTELGLEIGVKDYEEFQYRLNLAGGDYQFALNSPPKSEQKKLLKQFNEKINELDEIITKLGLPEMNRLEYHARFFPGYSLSTLEIQLHHAKCASERALQNLVITPGGQRDHSLYVFIFWLYLTYRQLTKKNKKYAYPGSQYKGEVINYLEKCLKKAGVFKSRNTIGDTLKEITTDPAMSDYIDHSS